VDILNPAYSRFDDSIHSYIGTLGVKGGFGPFGFAAEGNWGRNWGNTRGLFGTSAPAGLLPPCRMSNGTINNATTYSYWFDVWYKIGPVTPHVMFGQMKSEVDVEIGSDLECQIHHVGFQHSHRFGQGFEDPSGADVV
jgi:hypothetical protein